MEDEDHDIRYYRKDWMSDDQWACAKMFAAVVGGFHHVTGSFKPLGYGIKVHVYGGWATFDNSRLTGLVVAAHDHMIRVALIPSGPCRVGFGLWKRHKRDGSMYERHPTIEDAIKMHRPKGAD
jgi:hypothetical protein